MKERSLIFSGPMVRANLEGRKTQTRRVIIPQPKVVPVEHRQKPEHELWPVDKNGQIIGGCVTRQQYGGQLWGIRCPYGVVGDRFYIRESHYRYGKWVKNGRTKTGHQKWRFKGIRDQIRYLDERLRGRVRKNTYRKEGWYKRPSIFMPKWAARPERFEITDIRVERVQDINETDATAEGCLSYNHHDIERNIFLRRSARYLFKRLWDSINAKRGYGCEMNPWVWVICYRKL